MQTAQISVQRDGEKARRDAPRPLVELVRMLDEPELEGRAANERDCLSFMLAGWPGHETATSSDECFTEHDMLAQIDDLRTCPGAETLELVLNMVEGHVRMSAPSIQ